MQHLTDLTSSFAAVVITPSTRGRHPTINIIMGRSMLHSEAVFQVRRATLRAVKYCVTVLCQVPL